MTTELATSKSFEEKLQDKIKESFGDLLSNEELKTIITTGIDKILFQPRMMRNGYGGNETKPPLIVEILQPLLEAHVKEFVIQWLKDNPQKVDELLKKALEQGAGSLIFNFFTTTFQQSMWDMQESFRTDLRNRGVQI